MVLEVRWNSLPFRWPCYAQVQRFGVIQDKSELLIAVWIILILKGYHRCYGTTGSSTMWESMDRGDLRRP
ncbi:hypothetical protein Taro_032751 [Colocasia esculenta]|uniref:Uncharacterized protein n=1 Tax=Colocasia esculenta TaxID=4460 RepID=A0A843WAD0_COLES|nr:hypothetical protein [Colocasia esculenta]